jgi:hypothetical protein
MTKMFQSTLLRELIVGSHWNPCHVLAGLQEMCPSCSIKDVPASGPSPVLLRPRELALVAPDWETYSAWIENNKQAADALGEDMACKPQGIRLRGWGALGGPWITYMVLLRV